MHILKATHEDDGAVVVIDCYYDTVNENEKFVYYTKDGELKSCNKSKLLVTERAL